MSFIGRERSAEKNEKVDDGSGWVEVLYRACYEERTALMLGKRVEELFEIELTKASDPQSCDYIHLNLVQLFNRSNCCHL